MPEYLTLYLRSETAQSQLQRSMSGSVIRVLSSPNLEQLIVYLPPMEKQQEIVRHYNDIVNKRARELLAAFPNTIQMNQLVPLTKPLAKEPEEIVPLAQIIQTKFPYPLSRAYTVLENSKGDSYLNRLKKLTNLSEAIVYYIYAIFAADQLQRLKLPDIEINELLKGSLIHYSIDRRIKYIFRIIKLSKDDSSIKLFVPELLDINFGICSEINNKVRNVFAHTDKSDEWCKRMLSTYEPKLQQLMKLLSALQNYRLIQITNVSYREKRYQHNILTMMGNNPLFQTQPEELDNFLEVDTQHIVLLDESYNTLDFHPFYLFYAWEDTGLKTHLCFLKQLNIDSLKQKMKFESLEGVGETDIEIDSYSSNLFSDLILRKSRKALHKLG